MLSVLLFILAGTVVVSCAITPAIYSAFLYLFPDFPWPYSRVFDRVILVVALALFYVERRRLKLPTFDWRKASITGQALFLLGSGIGLSLLTSIVALYASVFFGQLVWSDPSVGLMVSKAGKAVLTAGVVSVLEEVFFRALVYSRLATMFGHWTATGASSFLYAVVHFIAPDKKFVYPGWSPWIGFEYLGIIMGRLAADGVVQGVFGLFLVGAVLCEAYRRSGSLWLPIGLHAGWVFALKCSLFLTSVAPGHSFAEGVGRRYFFVAEPATWVCVLIVWLFVRRIRWNPQTG